MILKCLALTFEGTLSCHVRVGTNILFNEDRVSVWDEGKVLELEVVMAADNVDELNANESYP